MSPRTDRHLPSLLTRAETLPSLPAVAVEVLRLCQDDSATIEDLARTLGRDPALAAKLLKLSNSSLFSLGQEVTTLERATMVLGLKTVKLMSLSFSLAGELATDSDCRGFDLGAFWHRSLVAAVAARALAQHVGSDAVDEAFLCGLLGHLGRLVLAQCMPTEYAEALRAGAGWPSLAVEEGHLGFHSADAAGALLEAWQLPTLLRWAVAYRQRPGELPASADEQTRSLVVLGGVAEGVEEVLCGRPESGALPRLEARAAEAFGMAAGEVEDLLLGLEEGVRETADMLDVRLPEGLSHQAILDQARMRMVDVSLGTAVDLQAERRRASALEEEKRELESRASTDRLTGLPNRAAFDAFLDHQVHARMRNHVPRALGVVMIDIDLFKRVNDTWGHPAGDTVLRHVGAVLARLTRKDELCARFGGEEFALVAPQTTPIGIKLAAERMRSAIEAELVEHDGRRIEVTASFGAACATRIERPSDGETLVALADRYLYEAKRAGRNRCAVYPHVHLPPRC